MSWIGFLLFTRLDAFSNQPKCERDRWHVPWVTTPSTLRVSKSILSPNHHLFVESVTKRLPLVTFAVTAITMCVEFAVLFIVVLVTKWYCGPTRSQIFNVIFATSTLFTLAIAATRARSISVTCARTEMVGLKSQRKSLIVWR